MIIRILSEGQYEVDDDLVDDLNTLDGNLLDAIEADDADAFGRALRELLTAVRQAAQPVPDTALIPSEFVLPSEDADLDEVRGMLRGDGLIPG
ncbi:hypothetical protein SK803_31865 [Lentzea sp. BCCO 10_0856]|uniref:PspA-associated domain-containing protein n=1 Tax=Lentzea miocenica TaxID=3095431 RepID=A0ABU4T9I7_9PSEU|nr:hypothetical protein [Lentzea sp. BCCO 10_0856]MDX8034837.1 hypothetical protein [Lentzea sp. BCCO 10_0856]